MKIRVFSADANPGVDAPLCRKSLGYVKEEIAANRMFMLNSKEAQCISRFPLITGESLVSASCEAAANSAISADEMRANVGIGSNGAVLRAQGKVRAWMSKGTADERAPLPRGKWLDMTTIEVSVVQ